MKKILVYLYNNLPKSIQYKIGKSSWLKKTRVLNNSIQLINSFKEGKDDCVVLDIGANFGYLSLVWANTIAKDGGKVIAFEPNKNVYDSFGRSISRNKIDDIIALENKAVGSENKPIKLFINNATSNTLSKENGLAYELIY